MKKNINELKKNQRIIQSKKRLNFKKINNFSYQYFEDTIGNLSLFKESKIVASFVSIKSEISTAELNNFILKSGKILCLPVINNDLEGRLQFKEFSNKDKLISGKYGINEPKNNKIHTPSIIFTPCLAYDKFGYRLGYGGGYYDKTISYLNLIKHKFTSIIFAFDDQKLDYVERDNFDQKINYILTEKQLYSTQ
ncbi:5-formyltetrahydrofolate cyclo-ligase [Alphaproteobacteria bacterium]|nr:5-formyltetrahydrofolate cyclo-ligase [Alphaproteobacteria bacterium]